MNRMEINMDPSGKLYCPACKKEITRSEYDNYDKHCPECFTNIVLHVKSLAEKNTRLLKGPDGEKFTEDVRQQKIQEERQRLAWAAEQLKKLGK